MLVTRVLGPCPACSYERFGIVDVHRNYVLHGCGRCHYSKQVWLPELRKKVLYLDQSFFSGAFSKEDSRFVELATRIQHAASAQLLTIPRSSIHDYETKLWRRGGELLDFIKQTSRGHRFRSALEVENAQILSGFKRWLAGEDAAYPVRQSDALSERVHDWDGYFLVDVHHEPGSNEAQREEKSQATTRLLDLFEGWKKSEETFSQCVAGELAGAKKLYQEAFIRCVERLGRGDVLGLLPPPVIEHMRHLVPQGQSFHEAMKTCGDFFDSQHFARLPFQSLRARAYATLQKEVRDGAYRDSKRAREKLDGFYSDVDHFALYAPYCDAITMDKAMATLVSKPTLALEKTFGTKVFSLNNIDHFHGWLDELEAGVTDHHRWGLSTAYPDLRL